MHKRILPVWIIAFLLTHLVNIVSAQSPSQATSFIRVLAIQGDANYLSSGWKKQQPILAGTALTIDDQVFPLSLQTADVLCPDGRRYQILASQVIAGSPMPCPTSSIALLNSTSGQSVLERQRAGAVPDEINIPYVISPRRSIVRSDTVVIRWNHILNVEGYTLKVKSEGSEWESEELDPTKVVTNNVAQYELPFKLEPGIRYSVNICVYFPTETRCTDDLGSDWKVDLDLGFYYVPDATWDSLLKDLLIPTGETAESLMARATLLAQPRQVTSEISLGAYSGAIELLEIVRSKYPNSAYAQSPEIDVMLGDLYSRVYLLRSAWQSYKNALKNAPPNSDVAARAAVGYANTTLESDSIEYYDKALDYYSIILDSSAFRATFMALCRNIGDSCSKLRHCKGSSSDCKT